MNKDKFIVTVSGSSGSSVEMECYEGHLCLLGALLVGAGLGNRKVNWYCSDETVGFVNRYGEFGAFKTGSCAVYAVDARYTKPNMSFDEVSSILADDSVPFVAWVMGVENTILTPELYTFAIYSDDDNSLSFYSRRLLNMPEVGDIYEGLTVTAIYTDFLDEGYSLTNSGPYINSGAPWSEYMGTFPSKKSIITSVRFVDKISPTNTKGWFAVGRNITEINNLELLDTSNVTDMSYMFAYCDTLTSLNLSNFETSNVSDMSNMFNHCDELTTININSVKFDTSKVTNMKYMFANCIALESIDTSGFDTSNVTSMSQMFNYCQSLKSLNLTSFDTSKVEDMDYMFANCIEIETLDLTSFDTSNVETMWCMFYECYDLSSVDVSSFDTSKVINMTNMFYACESLTELDLSSFTTNSLTSIAYMFYSCLSLVRIYASCNLYTDNISVYNDVFFDCPNLLGGWGTTIDDVGVSGEYAILDTEFDHGLLTNIIDDHDDNEEVYI